jgi:hypothetical protein
MPRVIWYAIHGVCRNKDFCPDTVSVSFFGSLSKQAVSTDYDLANFGGKKTMTKKAL